LGLIKENRNRKYPAQILTCCPGLSSVSAPGLSGVPDAPHAVNVSFHKTEGNGVGVSAEPPVYVKRHEEVSALAEAQAQITSSLCFNISLGDTKEVAWETLWVGRKLYVETPCGILPDGSKESFVTLLEYAEEVLKCSHVIVCFRKERSDRASLIRTFMYLGFAVVAPGHALVPLTNDRMFMAYTIDDDDDADGLEDAANGKEE